MSHYLLEEDIVSPLLMVRFSVTNVSAVFLFKLYSKLKEATTMNLEIGYLPKKYYENEPSNGGYHFFRK